MESWIVGVVAGFFVKPYSEGYYQAQFYISGRCSKTVITIYKNYNLTGAIDTYTFYN